VIHPCGRGGGATVDSAPHHAIERQARPARIVSGSVAIAQIDQEVGFPPTVGKEFGIDLGRTKTDHRSAIRPQQSSRDDQVRASVKACSSTLASLIIIHPQVWWSSELLS